VEFIENEKLQISGRAYEFALFGAGKDQLEHHIIGEQDIGRILDDDLALLFLFLPGIFGETEGIAIAGEAIVDEFLQFAILAVGEGVHRVDDDRLDALTRAVLQNRIDDGDDISQTLARTGAGGEDIREAGLGRMDGIGLMTVQAQRLAQILRIALAAENGFA